MIIKYIYVVFLVLSFPLLGLSQNLTGTVMSEDGEVLIGATVSWQHTDIGASTDVNGKFEIPRVDTACLLVINYVGYNPVYIGMEPHETVVEIEIEGITNLEEVEVTANQQGSFGSTLNPINTETLTACELKKAPCCNLSESFETNASVDLTYGNAILGTKEIQMLGLRGIYTQLLVENRPALSGLGGPFAMEFIPGTWIESIQISKGASSVLNGYQSIAGQINTELVKPHKDNRLFINLFGNTTGRSELNLQVNKKIKDSKWSTGLLLHGSTQQVQIDRNNDNFMDSPLKNHLVGLYRLFRHTDVSMFQLNLHGAIDRHVAGQINPIQLNDPVYRITQDGDHAELFGKYGYFGFEKNLTMALIGNVSWHRQKSFYGNTLHNGEQKTAYLNWIFSSTSKNEAHTLDYGASYSYDEYNERLNDTDVSRTESVPGIFAQYTYGAKPSAKNDSTQVNSFFKKIGFIAGLRLDQHNLFGTLLTPRANLKYNFSDESIIRFSLGRGFRTPNIISENINTLASNRVVNIVEDIEMEEAWNTGMNFTQNYKLAGKDGQLSFDLYHTRFEQQLVVDMEEDFQQILFYNLDGESYSTSFLTTVRYELLKGLDLKLAYKFTDVKITYSGDLREKPLIAKHRGLVTLDYTSRDEAWLLSLSTQLIGPQRWHDVDELHAFYEFHNGFSPAYAIINTQATRLWKKWEVYVGVDNLTNFRQLNPILAADDPFGPYFNANMVYGPVLGINAHAGVRFIIQ